MRFVGRVPDGAPGSVRGGIRAGRERPERAGSPLGRAVRVSITLALEDHVPAAAVRGARRWLYAGDDPGFELPRLERVVDGRRRDGSRATSCASPTSTRSAACRAQCLARVVGEPSGRQAPLPKPVRPASAASPRPGSSPSDGTLVVCSTPAQLEELRRAVHGARPAGTLPGRLRRDAPAGRRCDWPGRSLRGLGRRAPAAGCLRRSPPRGPRARFVLERTSGLPAADACGPGRPAADGVRRGQGPCYSSRGSTSAASGRVASTATRTWGRSGRCSSERGRRVARLVKPLLHAPFARCARAMLATMHQSAFPDSYLADGDWLACERRVRAWRPSIPADLGVGLDPVRAAGGRIRARASPRPGRRAHPRAARQPARQRGSSARAIVFPWEGHAWEQVLTAAVRRFMPGTEVIGYDNLNFTRPGAVAVSVPVRDRDPAPARSRGHQRADVRGRAARERVSQRAGESGLRSASRPSLRSRPRPLLPSGAFILAACSIDTAQSIELLRKASSAFG